MRKARKVTFSVKGSVGNWLPGKKGLADRARTLRKSRLAVQKLRSLNSLLGRGPVRKLTLCTDDT